MSAVEDQFAATGTSAWFTPTRHRGGARRENAGQFNVSITGGTGTVQLQRRFDPAGAIYVVEEYTTMAVAKIATEPEAGVQYRLECTVFTTGPINYRLSN